MEYFRLIIELMIYGMNISDTNLNWILNWIIFRPNSTLTEYVWHFLRNLPQWSWARGCRGCPAVGTPFLVAAVHSNLEDGPQMLTQFSKCSRSVHKCVTTWLYNFTVLTNWYADMGVLGAIVAQLAKLHLQGFIKDCHFYPVRLPLYFHSCTPSAALSGLACVLRGPGVTCSQR